MVSERDVSAAIGSTAYGSDGESVGTVETFYNDDRTGATTWVSLSSGLLGRRRVIAPAEDATFVDGRLQLTVPAQAVSHAPRMGGEHLTPEDEDALRRHYAAGGQPTAEDRTVTEPTRQEPAREEPVTEPAAPPAGGDGSMVRSEEQLRVGTARFPARRVRVVKYVVTEEVQVTVPIRREEIRIEELPLGDDDELVVEGDPLGGRSPSAPGLPEEIVLHAERPVVTVEVVPVERVRLRTETVEGHESVTETLQREQVVVDQDQTARDG